MGGEVITKTIHNETEMIGRRIGKLIKDAGLSPDEFAQEVGINKCRIHQIIAGQMRCTYDEQYRIAAYFGLIEKRTAKTIRKQSRFTREDLDSLFLPGPEEQLQLDM